VWFTCVNTTMHRTTIKTKTPLHF